MPALGKQERVNSFLTAILICETIVCSMINQFVNIPYISVVLMISLILFFFLNNRRFSTAALSTGFIAFFIIGLTLLLSGIINGFEIVGSYSLFFVVFGITSMIICQGKININSVVKYIIILFLLYNILYYALIRKAFLRSENYFGLSMGIAYAVSTSVYIWLYLITYRNEFQLAKKYYIFASINAIVSLFIIFLDCRSRGPIIAAIIGLILFSLIKASSMKKIVTFLAVGICGLIIYMHFYEILISINEILSKYGIKVGAIDKTLFYYSTIGIGNGRDMLSQIAIELIKSSPLFGHGIGYYEKFSGGIYVHNLFLEILVSFGFFGLLVCVYFIVFKPFQIIRGNKKNNLDDLSSGYILFVICVGELGLLFSNSFWLCPPFWYCFFNILLKSNKKFTDNSSLLI